MRRRVLHRALEVEIRDDRVEVDVGRERAEVAQRGELAALVARRAEHEQPEEGEPLLLVEPTGDAEVEQRGAAVGLHDEVAAVQVAVEDAVDQRTLERRDEAGLEQRVGVDAGAVHRLDVFEREAAQPLHHEHAPRDHRRVRARHDDAALLGRASTPAMSSMFCASRRKSSSSITVSANSSTSAGGFGERADRDAADQAAA